MRPRRPEGIFDMIGPSTFDGGYSPSQVMSSAMARDVDAEGKVASCLTVKATAGDLVCTVETGAKADAKPIIAARITTEILVIFVISNKTKNN